MPKKPKRPCSYPGCPRLTDGCYCEEHARLEAQRYEKYDRDPIYDAYLERCLYIERSARRIAETIAKDDAVERLKLLDNYKAIDAHNIAWLKEAFTKENAVKCKRYLEEHYSA